MFAGAPRDPFAGGPSTGLHNVPSKVPSQPQTRLLKSFAWNTPCLDLRLCCQFPFTLSNASKHPTQPQGEPTCPPNVALSASSNGLGSSVPSGVTPPPVIRQPACWTIPVQSASQPSP